MSISIEKQKAFEQDIAEVINRYSMENESNTPDFILAQFVSTMLGVLAVAIEQRKMWVGGVSPVTREAPPIDKIANLFDKYEIFLSADMFDEIYQVIKQALEQAREEAYRICDHSPCDECMDKFEAKGFSAAREQAAKIAENHAKIKGAHIHEGFQFCVQEVASQIHTMKPEAEGK